MLVLYLGENSKTKGMGEGNEKGSKNIVDVAINSFNYCSMFQ